MLPELSLGGDHLQFCQAGGLGMAFLGHKGRDLLRISARDLRQRLRQLEQCWTEAVRKALSVGCFALICYPFDSHFQGSSQIKLRVVQIKFKSHVNQMVRAPESTDQLDSHSSMIEVYPVSAHRAIFLLGDRQVLKMVKMKMVKFLQNHDMYL